MTHLKDRSPRWAKKLANQVTHGFGMATVWQRPAPDFLIIGSKRGGTTSLFNHLLMHPGILGLYPKSRGKKSTDFFFKELQRSPEWYRSHFHTLQYRRRRAKELGYTPVAGEASPYYMWDPRIAQRVHALNPSLKAIALLRDPVDRAWSHYQERRANGVDPLSFEEALAVEPVRTEGELERMFADSSYYSQAHDWYSYRTRGIYLPQLKGWTTVFPREQLLVLRSEDMYLDTQATFDKVCDFLGVGQFNLPTTQVFNASVAESALPEGPRAELAAFFAPHNRALEDHLGMTLDWSC